MIYVYIVDKQFWIRLLDFRFSVDVLTTQQKHKNE